MGHEVRRWALGLAAALLGNAPAGAQDISPSPTRDPKAAANTWAVAMDAFSSSDADDTDIAKLGVSLDWRHSAPDQYSGLRVETARFSPLGQANTRDLRVYYRFADKGGDWAWNGQAGSDGDTVLGSFGIHNTSRFRQEYFLERDIVETSQGLERGLYYTFAGGALDLPLGEADTVNVLGAVQAFTGRNVRVHMRATYVHVLKSEWGLSAQMRTRVFHSSDPREFDYFSPEWHAEILPILQLRRFQNGWRYTLAAGVGAQRDSGSGWHPARFVSAQVTSPTVPTGWAIGGSFSYANTPTGAGYTYDYRQFTLDLTRTF